MPNFQRCHCDPELNSGEAIAYLWSEIATSFASSAGSSQRLLYLTLEGVENEKESGSDR
jgi:hypothetical protein